MLEEGTADVVLWGKLTTMVTWKRKNGSNDLGDLARRILVTEPIGLQRNDPKNETVSEN